MRNVIRLDFLYECVIDEKICYNGLNKLNERMKAVNYDELAKQVECLFDDFSSCTEILTAIGDETRQHLILEMLKMGKCSGVRVGEITEKTNLSRPAVSHHLQIMKKAGLVKVQKEGTKNFYYFSPETKDLEKLASTLQLVTNITKALPDRSGENE